MAPPGLNSKGHRRPVLASLGLCLGIIGLIVAVLAPQIARAIEPPKPLMPEISGATAKEWVSDTLADAGDKFVGKTIDRIRGRKPPPVPAAPTPVPTPVPPKVLGWDWYLETAGPALGLVASLAGLAGWLRREDLRIAGSALTVGVLAVTWVHIVTALVIALVIVFVAKLAPDL